MNLIMLVYYVICTVLFGLCVWNFFREKKSRDDLVLYILVMVPLVLRLLRWK